MGNQSGFTTVDFLFAMIIAMGMLAVTFAMTFTLSVVEVTQYITFSASRAHAAAHIDPSKQLEAGRNQYQALTSSPVFAPLYRNGWFEISKPEDLEIKQGKTSGDSFAADYPSSGNPTRPIFHGVRTKFTAKMLELKLPLLGNVKTEEDDDGFTTRIGSFLVRESTMQECQQWMEARKAKLVGDFGGKGASVETPWEDNGC